MTKRALTDLGLGLGFVLGAMIAGGCVGLAIRVGAALALHVPGVLP